MRFFCRKENEIPKKCENLQKAKQPKNPKTPE